MSWPDAPARVSDPRAILTPLVPVASLHGVTIALLTVELWSSVTKLRLSAVPSSAAQTIAAARAQALEQWMVGHARHGPAESPPRTLGDDLLALTMTLRDDVGTTYRSESGSAGGSDTEWDLRRTFTPGVPMTATVLVVRVEVHASHRLELPPTDGCR